MADRVAIIGGSTAGRDHFPFPVPDLASVTPEYFDVPLTLAQACKWFWLVKRWAITGAASLSVETEVFEYDAVAEDFATNTYTGSATWDFSGELAMHYFDITSTVLAAARESDLVRSVYCSITSLMGTYEVTWNDSLVTAADVTEYAVDILDPAGDNMAFSADALYPYILRHFLFSGQCRPKNLGPFNGSYSGGDEQFRITAGDALYVPGGAALPSSSLLIDAQNVPLVYALDHDGTSDVTLSITLSSPVVSIAVTPLEYWPYANSEGDPVYNTTTGAQLVDPLS